MKLRRLYARRYVNGNGKEFDVDVWIDEDKVDDLAKALGTKALGKTTRTAKCAFGTVVVKATER